VLRTRVITAVVLLILLVGMLFFAPALMWAAFMLVVALLGCWEWSRMSALPKTAQGVYLALSGAIGGGLWLLYARAPDTYFMTAASFSSSSPRSSGSCSRRSGSPTRRARRRSCAPSPAGS